MLRWLIGGGREPQGLAEVVCAGRTGCGAGPGHGAEPGRGTGPGCGVGPGCGIGRGGAERSMAGRRKQVCGHAGNLRLLKGQLFRKVGLNYNQQGQLPLDVFELMPLADID